MAYSARVSALLSEYSTGSLPLTRAAFAGGEEGRALESEEVATLFPGARDAQAALSGLLLLLGAWERSHQLSQDNPSREGNYWHAIAHRIEPDSANAGYWFRRVGPHPIFPDLHEQTRAILSVHKPSGWRLKAAWDPLAFIEWCDEARAHPGGAAEHAASEIQQAEWRLLFEWCALNSNDLPDRAQ
jgi:hypothetical protein